MRDKTLLRALFIGLCGVIYSYQAIGQGYDALLLKDYVTPDIKRRSLDLTFDSNGNFGTSSNDDENKSSIFGSLNSNFKSYVNTRKFIGLHDFTFNFSGEYSKNESDNSEDGRISPAIKYANQSRFYKDKLFFETGGNVEFYLTRRYGPDTPFNRTAAGGLSIPLKVGYGRIERVEDMRQAIYIADKLAKQGVIDQKISTEKMNEFAQLISTVKNKRFLDHRKHLIYEVTAVDSFLINNHLVNSNGANYFTTLYDYWLYGALFERKSGKEISGGVRPMASQNWLIWEYPYAGQDAVVTRRYDVSYAALQANVSFFYENPVSLSWQHSSLIELTGALGKNWYSNKTRDMGNDRDDKRSRKQTNFNAYADYYIGYYPNSRTNLRLGLSETFEWSKAEDYDISDSFNYYRAATTLLKFNTYYYISPQFRVSANAQVGYRYLSGNENLYYTYPFVSSRRSWIGDYSVSLTYSLF